MISNIVKSLRKNAGLTQKEAAEILKIEQRSWERYEAGDRIPSIQNLELFAIKTNQNLENIIKEEIKKALKKENYSCINGMIKGLELTSFEFFNLDQVEKLFDFIEERYSVDNVAYLLNIKKEIIREEMSEEIEELPDDLKNDNEHQFINWNSFAYLVEKYCL